MICVIPILVLYFVSMLGKDMNLHFPVYLFSFLTLLAISFTNFVQTKSTEGLLAFIYLLFFFPLSPLQKSTRLPPHFSFLAQDLSPNFFSPSHVFVLTKSIQTYFCSFSCLQPLPVLTKNIYNCRYIQNGTDIVTLVDQVYIQLTAFLLNFT